MLDLISKTTATAGLKINTDPAEPNNDLEICNKDGTKCFNISSDNDNLYIYPKGTVRADAPFKIVAATAGGKAYASINGSTGSLTSPPAANAGKIAASLSSSPLLNTINFKLPGPGTGGAGYIGHPSTPSLTINGGAGTGLVINTFIYDSNNGSITGATISNHGLNYTSVPTITIPAPPLSKPIQFTGSVSTNSTGQITTLPNITALDNGYYKPSTVINITNNPIRATATAVTNAQGVVTSITITNPLDNGFYVEANAVIESIGNGSVTITKDDFVAKNFTYTKVITAGVWVSITVTSGGVGFPPGTLLAPLTVTLSAPETAVAATITPTITNGSIASIALAPSSAGSKYYKPTIRVYDTHLVTRAAATMPTLYIVS
jgi:hypothetical protein